MKKIVIGLLLFASTMIVGCATVPMASTEQDQAAKRFVVPRGKSGIYIYRNETMGGAMKMAVTVDGKLLGQTAPNTYFYTVVRPGRHTIRSVTENTSTVRLKTKPGRNYYIWQEVKMGMMSARSKLHLVNKAKGQQDVLGCELIQIVQ